MSEVNVLKRDAFTAALGGVFERSPWVAERAWPMRPFAGVDALHAGMMRCMRAASREEQLALLRAHPELAGKEAAAGTLTRSSSGEQERLGFTALSRTELERIAALNRSYREKFGFPCIVALRLHATRATVLAEMERRAGNDAQAEIALALEQIGHIARGRLDKLLAED
ncbi:MAG TPA: 2-oxo-4-hydroxy-4-carboxy-5-ureidoimidazoline decarboxylase [Burkholderiales bacterium]|nr:2-oxo-4-hydroxy-4-carboxy-5-ureidoimidazoline decarboxylase [Burkholderiales bacterium]